MRRTAFVALFALASAAAAQGSPEAAQGQRGGLNGGNRAGLELQLRQKLYHRVRVELGLAPEQMTKLEDVTRRFGQQQRSLDQRENQTRQSLRQALMEAATPEQDKRVGDLHQQLMDAQRQRLDLVAAEQKELAGFLTNVQRVRFQALQENLRRQMQDGMRQQGGLPGRRGGPPPS
jgi:hypothetical protein